MPSKYVEKIYAPDAYYHIFNRGVGKMTIFKGKEDYAVFLNLLKRYLSSEEAKDKQGRSYPNFHKQIDLLAFCLMPSHFHLFVFQHDRNAITELLRSICTCYTMYFNHKYNRVGHLFQGRFKASMITEDQYLIHISRYIHMNPPNYMQWEFSSLPYYLGYKKAKWLSAGPLLKMFEGDSYSKFLRDYENHKEILDEIKQSVVAG